MPHGVSGLSAPCDRHPATPAFDFFDIATGAKSERSVDYSKIMNSEPAQQTVQQGLNL
jgi:hypothetical protein